MKPPSERFEKSMTVDNLWIYVLRLLKRGNMYPYEMREKIKEEFGFLPGNMTAYIVLNKLKMGGFVKILKKGKAKGPERTYYTITPKGEKELEKAKKFHKKFMNKIMRNF